MFWRLDCYCHSSGNQGAFYVFLGVEIPRAKYGFAYVLQGVGVFDVLKCSKFCRC